MCCHTRNDKSSCLYCLQAEYKQLMVQAAETQPTKKTKPINPALIIKSKISR